MSLASRTARCLLLCLFVGTAVERPLPLGAQDAPATAPPSGAGRVAGRAQWLGGVAAALVAHESGHALANAAFGVPIRLEHVEFHGVPFFSLTHGPNVTRREEYVISSAGLWMQHASSEWLLTRHPRLRGEHRPFAKGVLAFNSLLSVGYAASAFTQSGPEQRDPRSIAVGLRVREPTVGAMILAPALLDVWRYYHAGNASLTWASRATKVGLVLLSAR